MAIVLGQLEPFKPNKYISNEIVLIIYNSNHSHFFSLAQSPEKMSYQAIIRDSESKLVANKQIGMLISILQGAFDGESVYSEVQTPTTNANGLVSIEIGTGTSTDDFSSIEWSVGPYFVKTETDIEGGTDHSIIGTSQLLSVPYALFAKEAANIDGLATRDEIEDSLSSLREELSKYDTVVFLSKLPKLLSELENDIGYLTLDTTLTEEEVDAFVANNGYLTEDTTLTEAEVDSLVANIE